MDDIIAGIGRSRTILTMKLLDGGINIGAPLNKYSKPGIYISGGDVRLSIMVRMGDKDLNRSIGLDLEEEILDWDGMSEVETSQPDSGTFFIRCTYRP